MFEVQKIIGPSHEDIAQAAYFHWLNEGRPAGDEQRHWFAAEAGIMQQLLTAQADSWFRAIEYVERGIKEEGLP